MKRTITMAVAVAVAGFLGWEWVKIDPSPISSQTYAEFCSEHGPPTCSAIHVCDNEIEQMISVWQFDKERWRVVFKDNRVDQIKKTRR